LDAVAAEVWVKERIEAAIRGMEEPLGMKLRKFASVLYVAAMGRGSGIPLFDSLEILGRERSLDRLRRARGLLE
ncbi:MAG: glutamate--tRNA ligase, partial [Dehalococcoidia bacterium]